jgi:hypothetical protein
MKAPLRLFAAGAQSQIRCNNANRTWYGSKSLQLKQQPMTHGGAILGKGVTRRRSSHNPRQPMNLAFFLASPGIVLIECQFPSGSATNHSPGAGFIAS